ncbi:MAG: SMEK domain-containing protein [Cyanobacteriota bacterium]|nr:SMEK domain-containing protein [Cyanobacteriota bacterium]
MELNDIQARINTLMTAFVTEIKGSSAMGRNDINKVSELVLIPIFKEIYGYRNLQNLNHQYSINYPSIDLGDEVSKVAIQVTATQDIEKIKDTLKKFIENKLNQKFNRLIIYILTEKQRSYSSKSIEKIINSTFDFSPENDILDYRDILKEVSSFQVDKARKIREILESNFSSYRFNGNQEPIDLATQSIYLNLLELKFPENMYLAEIAHNISTSTKDAPRKNKAPRDIVKILLEDLGLKSSSDWVISGNKIITFNDLENNSIPLSNITRKDTINIVNSIKYCSASMDNESIFKSLLDRCMQQKLYHRGVQWQNEEKLFIFTSIQNQPKRTEKWKGEKESVRTVYERKMKKNKPEEILCYKHLGFRIQY